MTMNGIGQIDRWVPEIWNSRLVSLAKKKSVWMDLVGGIGSGRPIVDYGDVEGNPGDTIHLPTTAFFTGNPITTDTGTVEGQGQAITPDELQITLKMLRFAAEWTDVAESYSMVNIPTAAIDNLSYQLADMIDENMFFTACASHTYNIYGGAVSADSSLASTDIFSVAACRQIRGKLGFDRALPLGNVASGAIYGIYAHPYNINDLKSDSNYISHVQYAEVRGASNPLFTGNVPIIDGLMILESHNVPYGATNNTTLDTTYDEDGIGSGTAGVTHMFAFGADAMALAYKWRPRMKMAEYDADTKRILHVTSIWGRRRLVEKSSLVGHYYATAL